MDLQQIIDVDEKSQTVTTNVWIRMSWDDYYLHWDPSEYGSIKEVRLPIESIWKPDVNFLFLHLIIFYRPFL